MQSTSDVSLDNLSALNQNEEKIRQAILKVIPAGAASKAPNRERIIKILADYPVRLLYALSERSPEINQLCESNDVLNLKWASLLTSLEYPSIPIQSIDGEKGVSLFSQLKGAFLLSELNKNPDLNDIHSFAILNKACELGMFQALIKRLNFVSESIKTKTSVAGINSCIQQILSDVQQLSNLYWSIGCLDASLILFNTVEYFFNKEDSAFYINRFFMPAKTNHFSWQSKYDDKSMPFPILILEAAMENIYLARILADFPQSKEITEYISHGKGLMAGHEESFKSTDELQKLVVKKLNMLNVPLVESFCRNAHEHSIQTIKKHHPEIEIKTLNGF